MSLPLPRFTVINMGYYGGFDRYHWECLQNSKYMEDPGYVIAISEIKMTKPQLENAVKTMVEKCHTFYQPSYLGKGRQPQYGLLLLVDKCFEVRDDFHAGQETLNSKEEEQENTEELAAEAEKEVKEKGEEEPAEEEVEDKVKSRLLFQYITLVVEAEKPWACLFSYRKSDYTTYRVTRFADFLKKFCNDYNKDNCNLAIFGDFNILRKITSDVKNWGCFEYNNKQYGGKVARLIHKAVKGAGVEDTIFTPTKVGARDAPDYFGMRHHDKYFDARLEELKFEGYHGPVSDHLVICQFPLEQTEQLKPCEHEQCDKELYEGILFWKSELRSHIQSHRHIGTHTAICDVCLCYYNPSSQTGGIHRRFHQPSWRINVERRNNLRLRKNSDFHLSCQFLDHTSGNRCCTTAKTKLEIQLHQQDVHGKTTWNEYECTATSVEDYESGDDIDSQPDDLCLVHDPSKKIFKSADERDTHLEHHKPIDTRRQEGKRTQCLRCLLFYKVVKGIHAKSCHTKYKNEADEDFRATEAELERCQKWYEKRWPHIYGK